MTITFCTREYHATHGRAPRGYGAWALRYRPSTGGAFGEPVWAPASTLALAKHWMKEHIRTLAPEDFRGWVDVEVCP